MATRESRGWVWTDSERESIKTWQRKLQNRHDTLVIEQLRRYQRDLPQFVADAEAAAKPFLDACRPLLALNGRRAGRKFQAISPEEAQAALASLAAKFQVWAEFTNRPEVVAAIRSFNAEQRALERRDTEQLAAALASPDFTRVIDARTRQVEEYIELAVVALLLPGDDYEEADRVALRRLALVHVIRLASSDSDLRRAAVARLVAAEPPPPLEVVLRAALDRLVRDTAAAHLKGKARLPVDVIAALLSGASFRLGHSVAGWRRAGVRPRDLPASCFALLGVDYSVR